MTTKRRDARFTPFAALALLFFSLLGIVTATDPGLYYASPDGMMKEEGPRKKELLQFGTATDTISFILVPSRGEKVESYRVEDAAGFVKTDEIVQTDAGEGKFNYTVPFTFSNVGRSDYKFSVKTDRKSYSIDGSYAIAGFVIKDGDRVVSGEDGPGVELGTYDKIVESPRFTYDVMAMGFDGDLKLDDVKITTKELKGEYLGAVKSTKLDRDTFTLEMAPYRVGTGQVLVTFELPSLEVDGETFMTSLIVKIDTSEVPPCVAEGGEYKVGSDGYVKIKMFNLLAPPAESDVEKVTLTVGDSSVDHDPERSDLVQPDQMVAFKPKEDGEASLFCVFKSGKKEAVIVGGKVTISGAKASTGDKPGEEDRDALAKDNLSTLGDNPGTERERMGIEITMRKYTPDTLTMQKAGLVMAAVRGVIDVPESDMAMPKVEEGSGDVIMTLNADVKNGTEKAKEEMLVKSFDDCDVQKESEEECKDMDISKTFKVDTVAATGTVSAASGTALAAWSIALIAVSGLIAILLLVVLSLWVVYRRSAEQSESDYSSSGPLGVPDPDDMLYQQSIVRDIYGRGDFDNGGPTTAAAEQRAREADLREEFPRPPSTSNASHDRGGTDDASSTYTV
eukprot:Plantae.Rhodophyta-Hildenbrandia_rubra.ctg1547.p1 GENE.Plantae.Rhodophyta-Hildenbrandia_rubra.ctg1547~~Plantae.Rhodophyta-Hildenbrandia_rubra.ctg1547.p1  ORF type:complete len:621 (+),score=154.58 Plantae.Rhodophyta-Hildenbrandia_rubra.ctg1547:381-2243(+)